MMKRILMCLVIGGLLTGCSNEMEIRGVCNYSDPVVKTTSAYAANVQMSYKVSW